MKKSISYLLLLTFFLPNNSWSQEVNQNEEPFIYPMNVNQPAPFPGILFNRAAASKLAVDFRDKKEEIDIIVKKAVADSEAVKDKIILDQSATCSREKLELSTRIKTLDDTLSLKENEIVSLKKTLEESPNRNTWFTFGFLGGITASLLTAFAVSSLTK